MNLSKSEFLIISKKYNMYSKIIIIIGAIVTFIYLYLCVNIIDYFFIYTAIYIFILYCLYKLTNYFFNTEFRINKITCVNCNVNLIKSYSTNEVAIKEGICKNCGNKLFDN